MNRLMVVKYIFAGFILSAQCLASENDALNALMKIQEIKTKTITADKCLVEGILDFESYINDLSVYRDAWLNKDYSIDFYNQRRKQIFIHVIAKQYARLLTQGLYATEKAQKICSFSISAKIIDKYGQDNEIKILSWKFSQKQNSKVNWDKVDSKYFRELALDYKFSDGLSDWISDEPDIADSKPAEANRGCDKQMITANAILVRASTTYCTKNYMDSQAGYYALEISRKCVDDLGLGDESLKSIISEGMHELDAEAESGGRIAACAFADKVELSVLRTMAEDIAH